MKHVLFIAVLFAFPSRGRAETYWPMLDSGGIVHDLRSRWNDPVIWCGEPVIDELVKQMTAIQRISVDRTIALRTKDAWTPAHESLVSTGHSYGFWRLSAGRTLVIEILCTAPTVCVLAANLIVRDGTTVCLERWRTVAYRGAQPPEGYKP